MTEKRYSLRINAKDKGVKIFDNIDEDNWRVLNLHFNNYDDTQFVRSKLIPVVALLNDLSEENEQLKSTINTLTHDNTKMKKVLNTTKNENEQIKHLIKEAYHNERTAIGKSVLKQLKEQIE